MSDLKLIFKQQYKPLRWGFLKTFAGISFFFISSVWVQLLSAEETLPEPEYLDKPTPRQAEDPNVIKKTIPAKETEQSSQEAPPSQPIDDERPTSPGSNYIWLSGYWWWTNSTYVWVPGYWSVPPQPNYAYVSGYWTYRSTHWVYVRGGWASPGSGAIIVYPVPRSLVHVWVYPVPRRIVRRQPYWQHYHDRRRVPNRYHTQGNKQVPRSTNPTRQVTPGNKQVPRSTNPTRKVTPENIRRRR